MATMTQIMETTKTPNTVIQAMIKEDPNIFVPTEEEIDAYCSQVYCPSSVMPHGVFALVEPMSWKIKALSQNAKKLFEKDATELLDTSLLELFHDGSKIEEALGNEDLALVNPVTLKVKKEGEALVNLILNRSVSGIIVDMEPCDAWERGIDFHQWTHQAIDRMRACDSLEGMRQQVCQDWHNMCGFDRVHVYQYHEDDHGEVITEVRKEHPKVPTALGLHYQASDTPRRTRQMLKEVCVRHVSDSGSSDKGIRMVRGLVFDREEIMSKSQLRPPHPNHKEFLANQGVAASITLSLVVKNRLWGVVQGYHMQGKRFLPYRMRKAGECLVQALANEISKQADSAALRRSVRATQLNAKLTHTMSKVGGGGNDKLLSLLGGIPSLMDALPGVTGVCVRVCGGGGTMGDVPEEGALEKLVQRTQRLFKKSRTPQWTESLKDWQRDLKGCAEKCAGALCVPLMEDGVVIFFRPELGATTLWGSSLETNFAKHNEMHAHVNFGVYKDDGKERCSPWRKWELEMAEGVGSFIDASLRGDADVTAHALKAPAFACDANGNISRWNAACAHATGISADDAKGKPLAQFLATASRGAAAHLVSAATAAPESLGEVFLDMLAPRDGVVRVVAAVEAVEGGVAFTCADATHTLLGGKRLQALDKEVQQLSASAPAK